MVQTYSADLGTTDLTGAVFIAKITKYAASVNLLIESTELY